MDQLEVIARMKIRPGHLEGFKLQAARMMQQTRDLDTQTLRYDWFIDEQAMECEVHENYLTERGMMEHNAHIMEARDELFRHYAYDHRMSTFGPISEELSELFRKHAGGANLFVFLQGLKDAATV
jgi:quinol monooxygenase YgiN